MLKADFANKSILVYDYKQLESFIFMFKADFVNQSTPVHNFPTSQSNQYFDCRMRKNNRAMINKIRRLT